MRRPLPAFVTLLSVALPWAAAAGASERAKEPERHMEVVQVQGAIDPVVADLITGSIERAQTNGASVVILQMDSHGALDTDPVALIGAVEALLVRNSWGTGWGDSGHAWLPLSYVDRRCVHVVELEQDTKGGT